MKRPVIKGTPLHKASIAKAKTESIVSQRRTQADSSLVAAGNALGESYIPAAIDFSIDQKAIKIPKSESGGKGPKTSKKPKVTKYIEEKEDDDLIEDAGLDDKKTKGPKGKSYENWKVREEKDNIRLAEENKARLDEASARRAYRSKEVTKIEPISIKKLPTSKKKLELEKATESADSKYVAPYVDEAEDKDNDYSGIENDNSDPTDGSTSAKNKPYKNWKVRENEKNIADAEANKAKADAASAKRVAEANAKAKADAEAKKNNTNFNYNLDNNSDIVAQEVPKTKPKTKSKVKVDPSVSAAETKAKKEFDNRDKTVVSTIKPKNIEQIPNNISEPKVEQALPLSERKTIKAHLDPNLNKEVLPDIEGTGNIQTPRLNPHDQYAANLPEDAEDHFTGSYNDYAYTTVMTDIDGDGELDEQEVWTYKGDVINENQVSTDAYTSIISDLSDKQEQKNNKEIKQKKENLNSNTPSNDSTSVDLTPQPQPAANNKTTPPQARTREQKENDKIYNDFRTSNYKKRKMIEEGYSPIQSKSPMEMRDNRIYRNAQVDGPVRKNMIKGGYTPK